VSEQPNSRRHPRFAVQIAAEVRLGSRTIPALTRDLSRGGICVVCPTEISPGTEIELALALSLGDNTFSEKLELMARVVWCTPMGSQYQIGAVFIQLGREKSGYLEMFLRFLQQEVQLPDSEPPETNTGPFDTGDADKP
jgi:Tfp pilus assembly protein PilZ